MAMDGRGDDVDAHAQVIDLKHAIPGLEYNAVHAQVSCQLELLATSSCSNLWLCLLGLVAQPYAASRRCMA